MSAIAARLIDRIPVFCKVTFGTFASGALVFWKTSNPIRNPSTWRFTDHVAACTCWLPYTMVRFKSLGTQLERALL